LDRFKGDWLMDAPVISALAALAGATIGGLTSVLASWLTQRAQVKARWVIEEKVRRQELYREFIEDASKAYVDALQHHNEDMALLVSLYAKIGRIRVLSSPKVVTAAEEIARTILDTYLRPDKSFLELRDMMNDNSIDILQGFSEACRVEFESLSVRLFSMSDR
jgi:hypothetical protein